MPGTHILKDTSCLSRTCLRWTPDGELATEDLQSVLDRLAAVDDYGPDLRSCRLRGREGDHTDRPC